MAADVLVPRAGQRALAQVLASRLRLGCGAVQRTQHRSLDRGEGARRNRQRNGLAGLERGRGAAFDISALLAHITTERARRDRLSG